MSALIGILVTVALLGALVAVLGALPAPEESATRPPGRLVRWVRNRRRLLTRRQWWWGGVGLLLGVAGWLLTGWVVLVVAAPIVALGLPYLLSSGENRVQLGRLDALESWTRNLSGLTQTGASLEHVLIASLSSAPNEIRSEVNTLVARLNARWRTRDALEQFAADLADPTADLVVVHLLLNESQRGPGLTAALDDLAQIIFEEVRVRRQVETDRAKPRQNMRIITLATLGLLACLPLLSTFMAPYRTPFGQMLLAAWLVLYALILLWLKRMTITKPSPRLLDGAWSHGEGRSA